MRKKINHKAIASKMIKHDLRNTVFLMLPAFDSLKPVHIAGNDRKLLFQPYTLQHYRKVKMHWSVCYFILERNPVNGTEAWIIENETLLNGTYDEAANDALSLLEARCNRINSKRRVNVGFALTVGSQAFSEGNVEEWVSLDPDFRNAAEVITQQDERREREQLIKALEGVA